MGANAPVKWAEWVSAYESKQAGAPRKIVSPWRTQWAGVRARGWRERERERLPGTRVNPGAVSSEAGGMQAQRADSQMCAPHEQSASPAPTLSQQPFQNSAGEHANPHSVIAPLI